MNYAGFWKRFAAAIIDGFVLMFGLMAILVFFSVVLAARNGDVPAAFQRLEGVLMLFMGWFYFAGMESSSTQGTLGKMAMKIKVTDMEGNKIDIGKATARHFGKILSAFGLVGYIMAAFTEKKQGLHDLMAGCLVVNK